MRDTSQFTAISSCLSRLSISASGRISSGSRIVKVGLLKTWLLDIFIN